MAGVEKHDVDKLTLNEEERESVTTTLHNNNASSSIENSQENVCIVSSANSNDILLYVGEGNPQVQDLLRVTLNQSSSTLVGTTEANGGMNDGNNKLIGEIQTLGTDNRGNTIISVPVSSMAESGSNQGQVVQLHIQGENSSDSKAQQVNNLFQLADLSNSLSTDDQEIDNQVGVVDIDTSQVLKTETETLMGDFIIANIDAAESERIPGELNLGDSFYCLEDVEEALRLYEEKHGIKLYKRDVRSLEALLKRSLKLQKLDKINERLKYGQLMYCCVYGGKRKAQKIACMDESGFARYTDCKMFIRFSISNDGMKLVVSGKFEMHNHEEVVSNEQETEPQHFTNTGNATEIRLGAGFVDLDELYKAIHRYETDNHVHLWRRDGRTVEALAKRAPGTARKIMETNPGLRFAELRFCCSYGGRQNTEEKKDKKSSQK